MIKTNKNIERLISNKTVPTFYTKREAQEAGKKIGFRRYDVQRIQRRFETVWVVAQSFITGNLNLPSFVWENISGSSTMKCYEVEV
jgi:hypothetical protein